MWSRDTLKHCFWRVKKLQDEVMFKSVLLQCFLINAM